MTPADLRRIAVNLPDAKESCHMGCPDFRVGRIFATLAAEAKGYGNLMLTPTQQADFIAESPDLYLPVHAGWGRKGITHIRLAQAAELTLSAALRTAYKLRIEKNAPKERASKPRLTP